mmetsp:Transcript_12876/g.38765  ORF Transcript_12876/g.38765 Transcript_12876/m.38765 type:complete len:222 (-) Transcript_12876:653-1318(-)
MGWPPGHVSFASGGNHEASPAPAVPALPGAEGSSGAPVLELQRARSIRAPTAASSRCLLGTICRRSREIPVSWSHSRKAFAHTQPLSMGSLPPFGKPCGPRAPLPGTNRGMVAGRGWEQPEHCIQVSYICALHLGHAHLGAFSTMQTQRPASWGVPAGPAGRRKAMMPAPRGSLAVPSILVLWSSSRQALGTPAQGASSSAWAARWRCSAAWQRLSASAAR